jgi:hypothetical protein
MSDRKVVHEVRLQKSVIIILGILAIGVCANVFVPTFTVQDAFAELSYGDKLRIEHSGYVSVN